ncbi:MAG: transglycosylase domain-containing protein [Oligoflexales bacterium]
MRGHKDPFNEDPYLEYSSLPRHRQRQEKTPPHQKNLWIWKAFAGTLGTSSVIAGCALYLWLNSIGVFDYTRKDVDPILSWTPQDNSLVFDRNGQVIGEFFTRYQIYTPYSKIPKKFKQAVLAIEDRRFFDHPGFDIWGIARAIWVQVKGGGRIRQGASTLTQQVVRNLLLSQDKTLIRKVKELFLSIQLEQHANKSKILEIYSNALFLGNHSYGAGAAAQRYFGKDLKDLKVHQLALIAGLFQSPSRYNPDRYPRKAKKRQLQVLRAMEHAGFLSSKESQMWSRQPLDYQKYLPRHGRTSPYFVDHIKKRVQDILGDQSSALQTQGLRIYTTLNSKLQNAAESAIRRSEDVFQMASEKSHMIPASKKHPTPKKPTVEGALLSTNPKTGEILAMVGGRNYTQSNFNRTTQAIRQPGSLFKAVVYSLALEKGYKWSDMMFVSPVTIGDYRPRTPQRDYMTETTILRAFYRSMNTPTVELGHKLGIRPILEHAKKLGIRSPLKDEFGSTLGSSGVTMFDLARVYSVFSTGGIRSEPHAIRKITNRQGQILFNIKDTATKRKRVLSEKVAFLTMQGMRDVLKKGTARKAAKYAQIAGGKTGTSNDSKDNWFASVSANIQTLVWVGTDEHIKIGGNMHGATLALPIWKLYMDQIVSFYHIDPFIRPKGVVSMRVHPNYGHLTPQGAKMWFDYNNVPQKHVSDLEVIGQKGHYRNPFGAH